MSNTTQSLIADMEALREHLNVERWLLSGVSWGSTLALAYAQAHPGRVSEIILMAVTTTSAQEVHWVTESMGRIFPREWDEFASIAPPGQSVIDAYYERITDPSLAVREATARAWCAWEDTHVSLSPGSTPDPRYEDPDFRLLFSTLVIHYWKHAAFLPEGLLDGMDRISQIPTTLIHGRLDVSGPLATAWTLHKAWPASELIVIDDEGHGGDLMIEALIAAGERFAARG
jgi:proline iminopeptidase